ncbi:hypothetical protein [Crossiella cryophila]|uniref:Uncharacterized protein n=1 Tax=Crossiella cryophila TaxID=43355 RepID=A0A7W7FUD4_9PSEU|nr:hypothetical protein [Crossiella cryophila]MBB4679176.1 hypothetical protein [Crossiella cryophila]
MADNEEPTETGADKPAAQTEKKVVKGTQRLETKHISGQVITHTIVKPIRGE